MNDLRAETPIGRVMLSGAESIHSDVPKLMWAGSSFQHTWMALFGPPFMLGFVLTTFNELQMKRKRSVRTSSWSI